MGDVKDELGILKAKYQRLLDAANTFLAEECPCDCGDIFECPLCKFASEVSEVENG